MFFKANWYFNRRNYKRRHIKEKISFLWYDLNYSLGYKNYLESDIVILQHPCGKEAHLGIGKIL